MNKGLNQFIKERDKINQELWEAYYEARKPMEEIIKKWIDAREEMNRPVREYLHKKLMDELDI